MYSWRCPKIAQCIGYIPEDVQSMMMQLVYSWRRLQFASTERCTTQDIKRRPKYELMTGICLKWNSRYQKIALCNLYSPQDIQRCQYATCIILKTFKDGSMQFVYSSRYPKMAVCNSYTPQDIKRWQNATFILLNMFKDGRMQLVYSLRYPKMAERNLYTR